MTALGSHTTSSLPAAYLEISKENSPKVEFPISAEIITIGRAPDNLLRLDDPQISRYHARITYDAGSGHFNLTDLGSADKTRINGIELFPRTPQRLKEGDILQIGSFQLKLCLGGCQQEHGETSVTVMVKVLPHGQSTVVAVADTPILRVVMPQGTQDFPLDKPVITLGRLPENNIVIDAPVVSSRHAQIRRTAGSYEIVDLDSLNGLAVGGQLVKQKQLVHGDVIYIGTSVTLTFQTRKSEAETPQMLDLRQRQRWTLGRDADNDTVINHPSVSRHHARIERRDGALVLLDLNSTNGTYVNGQRLQTPHRLQPNDRVNIGTAQLVFNSDETLVQQVEGGDLRLDALNLNKQVSKTTNLLNDISLTIMPREFVVIAGVSGGGKSTLLDALNGFRPATSGTVLVNNVDLYKNFNAYRTSLGYVPQDDIIHKELTVAEAFDYAAQLRMPPDTSKAERQERINEVLEDLLLLPRKDVQVSRLSGGQRKRVSIGVELITKPSLFYLDEATSGLDPATEGEIMRLLRRLADQGRTVLLITHATKNVMLCDKVVFLAFGGRVAYFGPPDESCPYFQVPEFDVIYEKVEQTKSPDEWDRLYRQSRQYQQFVLEPQKPLQAQKGQGQSRTSSAQPAVQVKQASRWQQFWILTRRNFTILTRDRAGLLLMLVATPLLGCLLFFLTGEYGRDIYDVEKGEVARGVTILFLAAMMPVIVGSFATMRELIKEAEIYRRERMIGLGLLPYLMSKVAVATVFSLYQALAFTVVMFLVVNIPTGIFLSLFVTLFLAILTAMMMGLLVSGLSPSQNVAPLLTILFLLPQIIFSGGLIPSLSPPFSIIKYPFESMVTLTEIGQDIANDPCMQLPVKPSNPSEVQAGVKYRDDLTDDEKKAKCQCLGPNIFREGKSCDVPGIRNRNDYNAADLNAKEPVKDPFPKPPTEAAVNKWVDAYTTKYSKWKEKTTKPVQTAEGKTKHLQDDYGPKLNVNLLGHWLSEAGIMAVMFIALVVVQKRKDTI